MSDRSLVVAQVVPAAVGGIRTHVRSLVPRLESAGIRAPVFTPDVDAVDSPSGTTRVPIPSRVRSRGWSDATGTLRTGLGAVAGRIGAVDVVHAHGLRAAFVADRARGRRPLVVTVHNVVLPDERGRRRRLAEGVAARILARADRLVAPSAAVLEDLPVALRSRAEVVVPVIEVPKPGRAPDEVRSAFSVPPGCPLIVCVARLHRQKRLDVLAAAWEQVRAEAPGTRLVLVGEGPERPNVEAAFGAWPEVTLAGALDPATDVLAAADLVVVTSSWEAVPLVLLESVVLGTPVVSTDVGIATEVLADPAIGTVVPSGDPDAVAVAILDRLRVGVRAPSAGFPPGTEWPAAVQPELLVDRLIDVYRNVR